MSPTTGSSALQSVRRLRADRVSFLVDAECYFAAVAEAVEQARHSVYIVGWDLHTEVRLRRDGQHPATLGALLKEAVRRNRRLHVHVLLWDYALIYLFERQPLPLLSFVWLAHPRIHVRHDDTAPAGASHHQKLVVLDDALAFVGGIDLTLNRWDTREHRADDERRADNGKRYGPFHDAQVAVTGEAARAVGELARVRWERATGRRECPPPPEHEIWPRGVTSWIEEVDVGLASTLGTQTELPTDIESTYVEAIASADRWLYFENQYFTSAAIGEALLDSLRREAGPEIVLVLPRDASGWLEQGTMDVLRTRLLRCLQGADVHGRLRVYHPVVPSPDGAAQPVYVHAKVFVADNRVARVGSANLSNRSMGFDSECDLLVLGDAKSTTAAAIATFRDSLLAEHLGCSPGELAQRLRETGSLISTIDSLRGGPRSLLLDVTAAPDWMLEALPDRTIVDPERPLTLDQWLETGLPRAIRSEAEVSLRAIALVAVLAAVAVAAFHVSGAEQLVAAREARPEASLLLLAGYCLAVVLPVPATLLHVGAVLVDGPFVGFALAGLGSALNATLAFLAGRRLGRDTVRRWAGMRLNRIARRIAKRGAIGVAVVRALPVTPMSIEGIVSGACSVRVGDYVVGTVLGVIPNLLIATTTVSALRHAMRSPSASNVALAALSLIGVALIAVLVARRLNPGNRTS